MANIAGLFLLLFFTTLTKFPRSNRSKEDIGKYIIEDISDFTEIRLPGQINGQQFIVQNCTRAIICLFDYTNTITIDDCSECIFFLGPVIGR